MDILIPCVVLVVLGLLTLITLLDYFGVYETSLSQQRSERKVFSVPPPTTPPQPSSLFNQDNLTNFDPNSFTAPSVEYFQYTRPVEAVPCGFDPEDVKFAGKRPPVGKQLEDFLTEEEETVYQIGIAFVGGSNGSVRLGHAEVVLRDGKLNDIEPPANLDLSTGRPTTVPDRVVVRSEDKLPCRDDIRLRVLHLRNARGGVDSLELALEPTRSVCFYRYADWYRIRTTERRLKHLALVSCPAEHRLLEQDCATFAHNFMTRLLGHLKDRGDITAEELVRQKKLLVENIHIEDGSVGQSEIASRKYPPVGKSAHSSIAVSMKSGTR